MAHDRIRIHGMRFSGKHGTSDAERERDQPIELDLDLELDAGKAAATDQLADTIDYARVAAICGKVISERSFHLLEALAAACLAEVFEDKRIAQATIRVRKPQLLDGATPEVELTRSNR